MLVSCIACFSFIYAFGRHVFSKAAFSAFKLYIFFTSMCIEWNVWPQCFWLPALLVELKKFFVFFFLVLGFCVSEVQKELVKDSLPDVMCPEVDVSLSVLEFWKSFCFSLKENVFLYSYQTQLAPELTLDLCSIILDSSHTLLKALMKCASGSLRC